ncbi:MAG: EamA family transporter RarD [Rhodobacteraceae bacterium]|nr:EamA family transporter RarD [Paracoccaceae bacterium]
MSEAAKGVLAMIAACTIWGLSGLFYRALAHVPPLEVLAHRTVWSLVFFVTVLAFQRRLLLLPALLRSPAFLLISFAALLVSANWYGFIWSVQNGRALEASLGYYIYPLVAVLIGLAIFREALTPIQWGAVVLAAIAVATLTAGLGATPWTALYLAVTFGFYGMMKRKVDAGPVVSVAAEVSVLAPVALVWLVVVHTGHAGGAHGGAFGRDWMTSGLLALSGVATGLPLMLFSYAARRVRMATLGLVQYVNPTLQFFVAVFAFGEDVTIWHMIAFPLIWFALAIYSLATLRAERRRRIVPAAP